MKKRAQPHSRRQEILRAALEVFTEQGYDAASIAELCERSGASVGSIYHHFGNKQQIAAELYLEGIRQVHQATLEALLPCKTAERGVRALSESYLAFCEKNPEYAGFLLKFRHAEFMHEAEQRLAEVNRAFRTVVRDWAQPYIERGELPAIDPGLYTAILIAPSQQYARQWLEKRARTDIASARKLLSTAGWHGLRALLARP